MITIFTERDELSTYVITKWLTYFKTDFRLVYPEMDRYEIAIDNNSKFLKVGVDQISLDGADYFWYRRGQFKLLQEEFINVNKSLPIKREAHCEILAVKNIFYGLIEKNGNLGSITNCELSRLNTLIQAEKIGIQVPSYLATNSKANLSEFLNKHGKIVIKPFGNGFDHTEGENLFTTFTEIWTKKDLKKLPAFFFPSLFLSYIEKRYEIRAFYLSGKFYSMAIMSQENKRTKVDFRRYNPNFPNRFCPYKIPFHVQRKLHKLIVANNLKTCSLDLIVNREGDYIFLEINPVGQFSFVGNACNYYLEKLLAQELIKRSELYGK